MVLGKLPVPGRPTISITVGQGPVALAVGAGTGTCGNISFIHHFFHIIDLYDYTIKGAIDEKIKF